MSAQWECLAAKKIGDDVSGDFLSNAGSNRFNGIADFADDMLSYTGDQAKFDANWIPLDSNEIRGNPSTNLIDWNEIQDQTDDTISFDLWSQGIFPSDTNWTLRFKLDVTIFLDSSTDNQFLFFGLSDTKVGTDTVQDAIGVMLKASNIKTWTLKGANNINIGSAGADSVIFTTPFGVALTYWEIKRTSATTVEATMFSDSSYSDVVEKVRGVISSGIVNLRYIKIANQQINTTSLDPSPQAVGTFDEVQFFNNTEGTTGEFVLHGDEDTSLETLGSVTFFDDFVYPDQATADLSWPSTDLPNIRVDQPNAELDFSFNATGNNRAISHDLGAGNVSDEKWVLDCKVNFSTFTTNTNSRMYFGLSDMDHNTQVNGGGNDADRIMIRLTRSAFGGGDFSFKALDTDDAPEGAADSFVTFTFVTGVDYFLRVARTSKFAYYVEVFTDSARTISLGQAHGACPETLKDLRYIIIQNVNATLNFSLIGTIDDVAFYNDTVVREGQILDEDFSTYGAPVTADFTDVFDSATGWTTTDSTRVRIEDDQGFLFMMAVADGSNDAIARDILGGIISDTEWVLRYKISFQVVDDGSASANKSIIVGMFDGDQTITPAVNQDCICQFWLLDNTKAELRLVRTNNAIPEDNANVDKTILDIITTRTFYTELKRTGMDAYEMSIYDDALYSNLISRQVGTLSISGIVNLRYLKVLNQASQNGAGQLDATIDDVMFWDGRSTTCDVGASNPWVSTDIADVFVDICAETIQYNYNGDGTIEGINLDLGTPVSDSKWVFREKVFFGEVSAQPGSDNISVAHGLSDTATGSSNVAVDGLFINFMNSSVGGPPANRQILGMVCNNALPIQGSTTSEVVFTTTWNPNDVFYIEIVRESDVLVRFTLFSDENYTFPIESQSLSIGAGLVTSLRYVQYSGRVLNRTGEINHSIDNVKIWDGVDVADSFDSRRYLQLLTHDNRSVGTPDHSQAFRFNFDDSANYPFRRQLNGFADLGVIALTKVQQFVGSIAVERFVDMSIYNVLDEEKLFQSHLVENTAFGAGNAGMRLESVWKWVNTITKISRINMMDETGIGGEFDTDSEMVMFGTEQ